VRLEGQRDQRDHWHGVPGERDQHVVVRVAMVERTRVQAETHAVADVVQHEADVSELETEIGAHRIVVTARRCA
jgi:hypothetical protein